MNRLSNSIFETFVKMQVSKFKNQLNQIDTIKKKKIEEKMIILVLKNAKDGLSKSTYDNLELKWNNMNPSVNLTYKKGQYSSAKLQKVYQSKKKTHLICRKNIQNFMK